MSKIIIIGLGPGSIQDLTIGAAERICDGNRVFLRTEQHPTVEFLKNKKIAYKSYDFVYEQESSFDDVYETITQDLVKNAKEYGIINYCIPGHPMVAERTVANLRELEKSGEIEIEIVSGLSFIEPIISIVGEDPINGLKVLDGLNLNEHRADINCDNIITQVYDRMAATNVKLLLSEIYGDDYEIYIIKSAGIKESERVEKIPIYELDRIDWIDYLTSIYIPKMKKIGRNTYDMNNLLNIMVKLRSEEGCPWDAEQTHSSLREYVIEEAYEVADAIDNDDMQALSEELGDLLLQIIFHSHIGSEEGYFNIWNVISTICQKLIRRHPHVFGEVQVEDANEVSENWNSIKYKEKEISSYTDRLKAVPKVLPSLIRSYKIQKRAAEIGFDWDSIKGALDKVREEFEEIVSASKGDDKGKVEEEFGDLLFAIVNVCRFLNISPENALNRTIDKFVERFEFMETESKKAQNDLKSMSLEDMDKLWEMAKLHKNKKNDKK